MTEQIRILEGSAPRMWYKSRRMTRRNVVVMLLILVAVQLLGTMAFASECQEPCPDDTETSSCPPVCALCTSCTHAQTGIVQQAVASVPGLNNHRLLAWDHSPVPSHRAADIFHVPLLG